MIEVREVLRAWLAGAGLRKVAEQAGVDRKTARRYVEAARAAGLVREGGAGQLSDALVGQVVEVVRPVRADGRHGVSWAALEERQEQVRGWVEQGLQVEKIRLKLVRLGVEVPYRTLHRFCVERCAFGRGKTTVRVADGTPGKECQVDFARLGLIYDPVQGRRRVAHALIFTAVYSRHMFIWLTFSQTLEAVIAGCEAAWRFFGGVFGVLVPDNLSPVIASADAVNPTFTTGWLDYAQHAGFATDPARVRSPKDKPRVERMVQYVRGNFFAGEDFADLADAQVRAEAWCRSTAGLRLHGTTAARPAEVFAEQEAGRLLAPPERPYDVPIFKQVKVHKDFHVEVGKALYSVPGAYIGRHLLARADGALVKLFDGGRLVKTHPRQSAGGRSTDRADLPEHRAAYAMRDIDALIRAAHRAGLNVGIYAERHFDDSLPWTRMRQVYRLLGLVRRYGAGPVEAACGKALELDVLSVSKISSMLAAGTEHVPIPPPRPAAAGAGRFARDPAEFNPARRAHLTLLGSAEAPERSS
ncbi:IS21 family transposase [Nonomuraea fuscirosea]|uniref:IS21 family transposase n=2 Tax=Nonomuraea fuscirosea TaxID=1291556 RepID=UPI0034837F99